MTSFSHSQFPFDPISRLIDWIPGFIDGETFDRGWNTYHHHMYETLINTILVVCRARPAALSPVTTISLCKKFVRRLNSILKKVQAGQRYKIEIVRRWGDNYFITSKYNDQFVWKHSLTHREVGINLGMFAPGHMPTSPACQHLGRSFIVETSGRQLIPICFENILMDYVEDSSQIDDFFQEKVDHFNNCMQQLKLPYHFEWFWRSPEKHVEMERVMKSDSPPDASWYQKNYYFINHPLIPGVSYWTMSFCSRNTRHDRHWHIIQMMYNWTDTQVQNGGDLYYEDVQQFFNQVQDAIRIDGDSSSTDEMTQATVMELIESVQIRRMDSRGISTRRLLVVEPKMLSSLRRVYETIRMHSTERWKLYSCPTGREIRYPPSGNEILSYTKKESTLFSRFVEFCILRRLSS